MAARLVKDPQNTEIIEVTISSLALTVGDIVELEIGATAWTIANNTTEHWFKKAVAAETVTSSATVVKVIPIYAEQTWEVDGDSNSSSSHDGDRMILSVTAGQVQNTGSDDTSEEACFIQERPVGTAADQRVLGHFVEGTGINPDAS